MNIVKKKAKTSKSKEPSVKYVKTPYVSSPKTRPKKSCRNR